MQALVDSVRKPRPFPIVIWSLPASCAVSWTGSALYVPTSYCTLPNLEPRCLADVARRHNPVAGTPPLASSDKGVLPTPLPTPHSFRATRRLCLPLPSPLVLNNGEARPPPHSFQATRTLSATSTRFQATRGFFTHHHYLASTTTATRFWKGGGSAPPTPPPHSF